MGAKRIGLRKVRGLKPGETIWDATVSGFGARRQIGETPHALKPNDCLAT